MTSSRPPSSRTGSPNAARAPRHAGTFAIRDRASGGRHLVTLFRSLSTMLDAGLPLFAIFEFLAREGEHPGMCQACSRIAQRLVSGASLHQAVAQEPAYFSPKAVRMMEAGFKGGTLSPVLLRLAIDEERTWKLRQQVKSQLVYPLWISGLALVAVLVLPPLVLNDLLSTVVAMTSEPPALTRALLQVSGLVGSWPFLLGLTVVALGVIGLWRSAAFRLWLDEKEPWLWSVPAVGPLWQDIVSVRFLRVFAMTYEAGLAATNCLLLASSASGSTRAHLAGPRMKTILVNGASMRESLAAGQFLPEVTLEAVEAGEQVGRLPSMLESAAQIIETEVETRIEAVTKLIEPLVLAILGVFVGVFALGCLLPIIKLTESL